MEREEIIQLVVDTLPLVSVLIPLYNAENYLAQCLDSVVNQTYKNLEVIIVNDGSTDNSFEIVNKYAKEYSYIKVFSQKNSGAQIARNKAFKLSSGKYIQYLDADDCLHHEKIFIQIQELLKEKETTLCFGKCEYFQGEKQNILTRNLKIYNNKYFDPCDFLYHMWLNTEALPPLSYLIPRSIIKASGGWDETLKKNQDGEFFARVILFSQKILFTSESISYYRMDTPNSISKNLSYQSLLSIKKSIDLYVQHSKKCKQDFTEALRTIYTVAIMKLYPLDSELARKVTMEKEQLGINGFRYPKRTKIYDLLFTLLGIRVTALLHKILLRIRSIIYEIKAWRQAR